MRLALHFIRTVRCVTRATLILLLGSSPAISHAAETAAEAATPRSIMSRSSGAAHSPEVATRCPFGRAVQLPAPRRLVRWPLSRSAR